MKRKFLEKNKEIILHDTHTGQNVKAVIMDDLGEGGTSLIYLASFDGVLFTLKECAPLGAGRIGDEIDWSGFDEQKKISVLEEFSKAYERMIELNQRKLWNAHATPLGLYEANNTMYVRTEPRRFRDFAHYEFKKDRLRICLRVIRGAALEIAKMHDAGFLHLDIKPENIGVADSTEQFSVYFFDYGSVMDLEEVRTAEFISISDEYSPFELIYRPRSTEVTYRTDIYQLGASMFSVLMGRRVRSEDRQIYSTWDFSKIPGCERVDPGVYNLLKRFFRKTLSNDPNARYASCEDLIEAIDVMLAKAEKPYIISDLPISNGGFYGRKKELENMAKLLGRKNCKLFVHGFSGIGKSELAKAYCRKFIASGGSVAFLKYDGEKTLTNVRLGNCTDDPELKSEALAAICEEEDVLLVVDNCDIGFEEADCLDTCLKLNCRVIITSTTDLSALTNEDNILQMDIKSPDKDVLISIFEEETQRNASEKELATLSELFDCGLDHPYLIRLISKYVAAGGRMDLSELKEVLLRGVLTGSGINDYKQLKLKVFKDDKCRKETIGSAVISMFDFVGLGAADEDGSRETLKTVLCNLHYVAYLGTWSEEMLAAMYYERSDHDAAGFHNAFNDLVEMGWIQKDRIHERNHYSLHTLTQFAIREKLHPTVDDAAITLAYFEKLSNSGDTDEELSANTNKCLSFIYSLLTDVKKDYKAGLKLLLQIKHEFLAQTDRENLKWKLSASCSVDGETDYLAGSMQLIIKSMIEMSRPSGVGLFELFELISFSETAVEVLGRICTEENEADIAMVRDALRNNIRKVVEFPLSKCFVHEYVCTEFIEKFAGMHSEKPVPPEKSEEVPKWYELIMNERDSGRKSALMKLAWKVMCRLPESERVYMTETDWYYNDYLLAAWQLFNDDVAYEEACKSMRELHPDIDRYRDHLVFAGAFAKGNDCDLIANSDENWPELKRLYADHVNKDGHLILDDDYRQFVLGKAMECSDLLEDHQLSYFYDEKLDSFSEEEISCGCVDPDLFIGRPDGLLFEVALGYHSEITGVIILHSWYKLLRDMFLHIVNARYDYEKYAGDYHAYMQNEKKTVSMYRKYALCAIRMAVNEVVKEIHEGDNTLLPLGREILDRYGESTVEKARNLLDMTNGLSWSDNKFSEQLAEIQQEYLKRTTSELTPLEQTRCKH